MAVVGRRDHAGVSRLKDLGADVVVDEPGLHHPEPDVREVVPGEADDGSWGVTGMVLNFSFRKISTTTEITEIH